MNTADHAVIAALTALRDAGMVTDRDTLNHAWAELTGRAPATSGVRCNAIGCTRVGQPFTEPRGAWCAAHVPRLWRDPAGRPWATPRCVLCGQPGRSPMPRFGTDPKCRSHAPPRMTRYLGDPQ